MADALFKTVRARVLLRRNDAEMYSQTFYEPDDAYTESTHQRVVLSTNMASAQEIDLSGVETAATLFLQTDRDIEIAVNNASYLWPVSAHGAVMLTGSFTRLFVLNESTTNQATVELVVTD